MPTTPNTLLYTADNVAEVAAADLKNVLAMPAQFASFGDSDFKAGNGNSIYLATGAALVAQERGIGDVDTAIVFGAIEEQSTPIVLDKSLVAGTVLSDGDLRLGIADYSRQVLKPMVDAVSSKINSKFATLFAGLTEDATITYSATDPIKTFTAGRAALRAKSVDLASADLVAVIGANVEDALLDSGALDYAATGDADSLRSGSVGKLRGFQVVGSSLVDPDQIVFTHTGAIYTAWAKPEVTPGMPFAATATANDSNVSLRHVRAFDVNTNSEKATLTAHAAVGITPTYVVTRATDDASVAVALLSGGQVVSVNTAA